MIAGMAEPLRSDEVATVLEAAVERRQPGAGAVAAWNRDRHLQSLSSRHEGWPDPPDLVIPRLCLLPGEDPTSAQRVADFLIDRGYELARTEEADLIVALGADAIPEGDDVPCLVLHPSACDEASLETTFPRVVIQVLGIRGDDTGKARAVTTAKMAREQIVALDDMNQFPEIRVLVGFAEPPSAAPEPAGLDLERVIQEIEAEALAAAQAAGVDVAPGERPPSEFFLPGPPVRWPGLEEQLGRARERNQAQDIDSWNEARLAARAETSAGGWREPPLIGSPRLFISYRWESEEHEAWVDRLAGELFSRGYELVYDRHPESIGNPLGADEVLYRLAECTCFVAIVTEQYLEATRLPSEGPAPWTRRDASWAKREWERALSLNRLGLIDCVAVWRSGDGSAGEFDWTAVIDCRAEVDVRAGLGRVFPELGVIAVATATDGQEYRNSEPVPRAAVRHLTEDMEQRFAPQTMLFYAAELPRRRWVALHSVEDSVTRSRIEQAATLESLRDVEFRHVHIVDGEHEQRAGPASDGELAALVSAAFQQLDEVVENFGADLLLMKFGVVATACPDRFGGELERLARARPDLPIILLATNPGPAVALLGDERPPNLAILSEPFGDQSLTDALACLFEDRYGVGT